MTGRNSVTRRARYHRVRDLWAIYDALPAPIRATLQEGPAQADVGLVVARYRKLRRALDDDGAAIRQIITNIEIWRTIEIRRAQPWQPPGHGRRAPLPSPHILAHATMQTSGRGVAP